MSWYLAMNPNGINIKNFFKNIATYIFILRLTICQFCQSLLS